MVLFYVSFFLGLLLRDTLETLFSQSLCNCYVSNGMWTIYRWEEAEAWPLVSKSFPRVYVIVRFLMVCGLSTAVRKLKHGHMSQRVFSE